MLKKILLSIFLINVLSADLQESYTEILTSLEQKNWKNVIDKSNLFLKDYKKSIFSEELYYYLGISNYHLNNLEKANINLSKYLTKKFSPKYYQEAFSYKFKIAKRYYKKDKKHLFGWKIMPKIISCNDDALKIFDEIIFALPYSELALKSFFYKGLLLFKIKEYDESINSFQELITKFPKSNYALESFLKISKIYLKKADPKHLDPNILSLANINLKKMEQAFPKEERLNVIRKDIQKIKEIFSKALFEIGNFYERTKKLDACKIYYKKIINTFPDTKTAKLAKRKLSKLKK
ncbi:MAG: hypothetical protein AMS24_04060 [Chlamydiae bacterium SM23_39]|nr:MAG: hypothetical protein AMS24_04060 [Chlamydiae bacterium SM23_39]